jgi:hypothetical protein
MFIYQIQINPGILNETAPTILNETALPITGPALSPDYGIISSAVTLIAGLLIFLTLDWRLDIRGLIWRPGGIQGTTNIPNFLVKSALVATFVLTGASVIFALFPGYSGLVPVAKVFFALAIVSLVVLTVKIIIRPPERNSRDVNGTKSEN